MCSVTPAGLSTVSKAFRPVACFQPNCCMISASVALPVKRKCPELSCKAVTSRKSVTAEPTDESLMFIDADLPCRDKVRVSAPSVVRSAAIGMDIEALPLAPTTVVPVRLPPTTSLAETPLSA